MSERPEHPLAQKLFRQFKAGSAKMTTTEAYAIGNELESQLAEILRLREAGAKLVEQVVAAQQRPPLRGGVVRHTAIGPDVTRITQFKTLHPGNREEPEDYTVKGWPYEKSGQ